MNNTYHRWFRLFIACLFLLAAPSVFAAFFESFESNPFPPPGWSKTNTLGGSGWYRLQSGVVPLPGWLSGTSAVPPTAGAGSYNAYCSYNTGGGVADGNHNSQYLITPALNGLTATSTLSFWLRCSFTNQSDSLRILISTNRPIPSDFIYTNLILNFPSAWAPSEIPPYTNVTAQIGTNIPPGTRIYIAFHEWEWDNSWNGKAMELDVISSDLTPDPEVRAVSSPLVFTAYPGDPVANKVLTYTNVGSGGFTYSNTFPYGGGGAGWISISPTSTGFVDRLSSLSITVMVNSAALPLGTYTVTNRLTVPFATNSPLDVPVIVNVVKRPQSLTFPNPGAQWTTNRIRLSANPQSGLPVFFSMESGPGSIADGSNLTFSASGTVRIVATQPGNWYWATVSATQTFTVSRVTPSLVVSNLSQAYDGSPCPVSVITTPTGLTVTTTYNGSLTAPTLPGSYTVTARVDSALFAGTQTETLLISKGIQSIDFTDPGPQFITNQIVLHATAESGLPISFAMDGGTGILTDGTNLSFSGLGEVSITASQAGDSLWDAAPPVNIRIQVIKYFAELTLHNLNPTYSGFGQIVTATTVPPGLWVDMDYNSGSIPPMDAGTHTVVAVVSDAAYQGVVTASLVIAKADQSISFTDPGQQAATNRITLSASASSALPIFLSVLSGPGTLDGTTLSFTGTGTVLVVAEQPGDGNWNPAPSITNALTITQAVASITLVNLNQTYNGASLPVGASTLPFGLSVILTYNGSTSPPVNAGSYLVAASLDETLYSGFQVATLNVAKANSLINFMPIPSQITTNPCQLYASATSGEPVSFSLLDGPAALHFGSILSFHSAGVVRVVAAEPGNDNWNAAPDVTNSFSVNKAQATILFSGLAQTYNGQPHPVTATTDPEGLLVTITYNGSNTPPLNAGAYVVSGAVDFALFSGLAVDTLVVAGVQSTVILSGLNQVYDGSPKSVSADTTPSGLSVIFFYDGSPIEPTDAGAYAVSGVVADVQYQGDATGTLRIAKADQTVAFTPLTVQRPTNQVPLQAVASSLLPVSFLVSSGPGLLTGGSNLSFTSTGVVIVTARQTGNANWNPSPDVSQTVQISSLATPGDYNNDATTDLTLVNPQTFDWYSLTPDGAATLCWAVQWGAASFVPVTGDYSGDGRNELAVFSPGAGTWYLRTLDTPAAAWQISWGGPGMVPVWGDYDGDARYDYCVYATGSGNWYAQSSTGTVIAYGVNWGGPGFKPVPGDYNGDGRFDLATYDSASGKWYIKTLSGTLLAWGQKWGGPGLIPIPGDFNGDGLYDLAVFNPTVGKWYISKLSGTILAWDLPFGWNGAIPVHGDYDADGSSDLAVYDPRRGNWYVFSPRKNSVLIWKRAWGASSLTPVLK